MNVKSTTILWLLERTPPQITCVDEHKFVCAYPLTCEQVLLQFHGYHKHFHTKTKMQSSIMKSIQLVVQNIKDIPTKTNQAIEKMILHDVDEHKLRKKNRSRKKTEETKK